jgi:hypothetical protein
MNESIFRTHVKNLLRKSQMPPQNPIANQARVIIIFMRNKSVYKDKNKNKPRRW